MLLEVATKNVKSRKPAGDLQFVPHGFIAYRVVGEEKQENPT